MMIRDTDRLILALVIGTIFNLVAAEQENSPKESSRLAPLRVLENSGNGGTFKGALSPRPCPLPVGAGDDASGARSNQNRPQIWVQEQDLSPTALAATGDGKTLYIACATANRVVCFDTAAQQITRMIAVPGSPLGLALSKDDSRLYVASAAPASEVCVIDPAAGKIIANIPVGHTAMSPVLSPDGRTLYVCNRFDHDVSIIDLSKGKTIRRVGVQREPVAAAITPNGKWLLVANHLPLGHEGGIAAAAVSVIDTATGNVCKEIRLPRGSGLLRGIAISPDGQFAAVTHVLARYYFTTADVKYGRINCNAISLLDLRRPDWWRLVLLDRFGLGAANPWAVTWTPDGKTIAVSHAGTHEVSLVEAPTNRLQQLRVRAHVPLEGNGPRALAIAGTRLYAANYFSDDLALIDLSAADPKAEALSLGPVCQPTLARQGERLFNDARLCLQQWQSCASCHDADARVDGLNWDLLNDGSGNPKNTRSLLWAHQTPPAMALGVRDSAETAVRAGIRHILFTEQSEAVPAAMDEYLKSLKPLPSPRLVNGKLSAAAERGRQIFMNPKAGCACCHRPPLYTDLKTHDVGTQGGNDRLWDRFDTPALVELWRTAPYLHDGKTTTIHEVLTTENPADRHGRTSQLTPAQLHDLEEYLLSL